MTSSYFELFFYNFMDWKTELNQAPESHKSVIDLESFLIDCCHGLRATPEEVIGGLLSADDVTFILSGDYLAEIVILHIRVWIESGKPDLTRLAGLY